MARVLLVALAVLALALVAVAVDARQPLPPVGAGAPGGPPTNGVRRPVVQGTPARNKPATPTPPPRGAPTKKAMKPPKTPELKTGAASAGMDASPQQQPTPTTPAGPTARASNPAASASAGAATDASAAALAAETAQAASASASVSGAAAADPSTTPAVVAPQQPLNMPGTSIGAAVVTPLASLAPTTTVSDPAVAAATVAAAAASAAAAAAAAACPPDTCANGGTCVLQTVTAGGERAFACECRALWGGKDCRTPLAASDSMCVRDEAYCQNGGACVNVWDAQTEQTQAKCVCPAGSGFGGTTCADPVMTIMNMQPKKQRTAVADANAKADATASAQTDANAKSKTDANAEPEPQAAGEATSEPTATKRDAKAKAKTDSDKAGAKRDHNTNNNKPRRRDNSKRESKDGKTKQQENAKEKENNAGASNGGSSSSTSTSASASDANATTATPEAGAGAATAAAAAAGPAATGPTDATNDANQAGDDDPTTTSNSATTTTNDATTSTAPTLATAAAAPAPAPTSTGADAGAGADTGADADTDPVATSTSTSTPTDDAAKADAKANAQQQQQQAGESSVVDSGKQQPASADLTPSSNASQPPQPQSQPRSSARSSTEPKRPELPPCAPATLNSRTPCHDNGVCSQVTQSRSARRAKCQCDPGFTGTTCELWEGPPPPEAPAVAAERQKTLDSLCSTKCNRDGTGSCALALKKHGPPTVVCQCRPGHFGDACQSATDCLDNPCAHGGRCLLIDRDPQYVCECTKPWTGPTCNKPVPSPNSPTRPNKAGGGKPTKPANNKPDDGDKANDNNKAGDKAPDAIKPNAPKPDDPNAAKPDAGPTGPTKPATPDSSAPAAPSAPPVLPGEGEGSNTGGTPSSSGTTSGEESSKTDTPTPTPVPPTTPEPTPAPVTPVTPPTPPPPPARKMACASSPCKVGDCAEGDTEGAFKCTCRNGYSGDRCDTSPCASQPCGNGECSAYETADAAARQRFDDSQQRAGFRCNCDGSGYTGPLCSVPVDECALEKDTNGGRDPCAPGVCLDQKLGFTCRCPPATHRARLLDEGEYSRAECQLIDFCALESSSDANDGGDGDGDGDSSAAALVPRTRSPCGAHGQCVPVPGGVNCKCDAGYTGVQCDIAPAAPTEESGSQSGAGNGQRPPPPPPPLPGAACNLPCANGGVCVPAADGGAPRCDCKAPGQNLGPLCNTAPEAPLSVTLRALPKGLIGVEWQLAPPASALDDTTTSAFRVEWSVDGDFRDPLLTESMEVTAGVPHHTTYDVELRERLPGLPYYVRVQAANRAGASAWKGSEPASAAALGSMRLSRGGVQVVVHFRPGVKVAELVRAHAQQASKQPPPTDTAGGADGTKSDTPTTTKGDSGSSGSGSGGGTVDALPVLKALVVRTCKNLFLPQTASNPPPAPQGHFKLITPYLSANGDTFGFDVVAPSQDEYDTMAPDTYLQLLQTAERVRRTLLHPGSAFRTDALGKQLEIATVTLTPTLQCTAGSTQYSTVARCQELDPSGAAANDGERRSGGSVDGADGGFGGGAASVLAMATNPFAVVLVGALGATFVWCTYCRTRSGDGRAGSSSSAGSAASHGFAPVGTDDTDDGDVESGKLAKSGGGLASQDFATLPAPKTAGGAGGGATLRESEDGSAVQMLERVLSRVGVPKYGMKKHTSALRDNYISRVEQLRSLDTGDWRRLGLDASVETALKQHLTETAAAAAAAAAAGASDAGASGSAAKGDGGDRKEKRGLGLGKAKKAKPAILALDDSTDGDTGGAWDDIEMGDLGGTGTGTKSDAGAAAGAGSDTNATDDESAPLTLSTAGAGKAVPKLPAAAAVAAETKAMSLKKPKAVASASASASGDATDAPKRKVKSKKPSTGAIVPLPDSPVAAAAAAPATVASAVAVPDTDFLSLDSANDAATSAPAPTSGAAKPKAKDDWEDFDLLSS